MKGREGGFDRERCVFGSTLPEAWAWAWLDAGGRVIKIAAKQGWRGACRSGLKLGAEAGIARASDRPAIRTSP
jgi:hypothetical protein